MAHIFTTIPTLTHTFTPNNPHNIPPYLSLWELILNTHFTPEQIREEEKEWRGDMEDLFNYLLLNLYNNNRLFACNPLTGEIIYHYNNTTGEEYIAEDITLLPSTAEQEVVVC